MQAVTLFLCCAVSLLGSLPTADTEQEIRGLMDSWRQAMLARNRAVLETLYSPDLVYCHSDGRHENKSQAVDAVVNGPTRYSVFELAEPSIRIYDNTALVQCKINITMSTDGRVTTLLLDVLHVWIKNGGKWQLVSRHATRLSPPGDETS